MAHPQASTYRLQGREILDARVVRVATDATLLREMGLTVRPGPDGRLTGRLRVPPLRFDGLADIMPEPVQAFVVTGPQRLSIMAPSPLSRCGMVPFGNMRDVNEIVDVLAARWRAVVDQTREALQSSRQLAANARVMLDPWRIEGQIEVHQQQVRLLFSPKGNMACINGLGGRPLVERAVGPRVMIPVPCIGPAAELQALWQRALAQANQCVAQAQVVIVEDEAMSLDIADEDLVAAYEAEAKRRAGATRRSAQQAAAGTAPGRILAAPPPRVQPVMAAPMRPDPVAQPRADAQAQDTALSMDMSIDFNSSDLP